MNIQPTTCVSCGQTGINHVSKYDHIEYEFKVSDEGPDLPILIRCPFKDCSKKRVRVLTRSLAFKFECKI